MRERDWSEIQPVAVANPSAVTAMPAQIRKMRDFLS